MPGSCGSKTLYSHLAESNETSAGFAEVQSMKVAGRWTLGTHRTVQRTGLTGSGAVSLTSHTNTRYRRGGPPASSTMYQQLERLLVNDVVSR